MARLWGSVSSCLCVLVPSSSTKNLLATFRLMLVLGCSAALTGSAHGQATTGLPPFSTTQGGLYDDVKINDGAILLKLPVRSKAGLIPFSYSLVSNNVIGTAGTNGVDLSIVPQWTPQTSADFSPAFHAGFTVLQNIQCNGGTTTKLTNYQIVDGYGGVHSVPGMLEDSLRCYTQVLSGSAIDGSGYSATVSANGINSVVHDISGNEHTPGALTDPNGNSISLSGFCTPSTCPNNQPFTLTINYQDTTGLNPMTEVQTWTPGPLSLDVLTKDAHNWTDASGKTQSFTVNYSSYTQQTNFGCGNDIGPGTQYFPSTITTPDGPYTISYEATGVQYPGNVTGRIAQITFPTGASVQYKYSGGTNGNGFTCGSLVIIVPVLTRILTDTQGTQHQWTYDTTKIANATVVTDPSLNDTVYRFYAGAGSRSIYEIERQLYQGSYTANKLLKTVLTCYNGKNLGNCANPQQYSIYPPIIQKDVYTSLPGMTQTSLSETKYYAAGNLTEDTEYDFTGTPISDRVLTYGTYSGGNCTAIGNYIGNRVCTDLTQVGTTPLTQTNNSYSSFGNLLSSSHWVSGSTGSGGTYLTSSVTYNANGTVNVATDVNGAQTTYGTLSNYTCNGNFPTSVSEPLSLTRSMTWDCVGGVPKSITDENNQTTTYTYFNSTSGYADPFYRLLYVTNPPDPTTAYVTNYTYTPTTFESAMNFNGSVSTSDSLTTTDGFGHTLYAQTRQGQGSSTFDTIQYTYDSSFRLYTTSISCSTGAGQPCSTPVTTTTYDGLSRVQQVTDAGTGYVKYNYAPAGTYQNDVLTTVGPAPTGENLKQRQLEYNALGWLTSVCELTSPTNGGGTCAQTATQTGYWARYSYSGLGQLTNIIQNAQGTSQTRGYKYDGLGRLTSETNPEWGPGSASYTYDSDSSGTCPGTYKGDLVKRIDNATNITCHTYDALHRQLSSTYSGPNATTNRYFVYDAATVNGQAMANAKTRMAEAYTATCATCTKLTDEGMGYGAMGELTQFYESTPHSAGYYSVPTTFWPNGQVATLGPFLNEAQVSITPDGEGRPYSIGGASSAVPSITYNAASQVTQIMTSCSDPLGTCFPINYTYDPNTLRMTQYGATLTNGTSSGTLTWNPNGSLRQLVVADQRNSGNVQTCNYSADDLSRIASVNCGSVWAQTFSYDAFGNITKSGSVSWMPGYSTSTNRYSLGGTSYDADGNLLNDSLGHAYTWDAEGKQLSGATYGFTYDAFGHLVEVSTNGSYSRSYVKLGKFKFTAVGQTASYSETPLPGGSVASQNSGFTGVQLADWLGTIRTFISYTGGNEGTSAAHAPFGEAYAYEGGFPLAFTGQSDSDGNVPSTLYWFPERQYSSSQGRWLSPDPAGLGAVNPLNPQSWNRYAYAFNNPLSNVDPLGLECVWDDGSYDSNDDPQSGSAGSCSGLGGTWVDHSYFHQNGLGDWSGDPSSNIASYAQNFTTTVTATPCPSGRATLSQRVTSGIQGTLNLALAGKKGFEAGIEGGASLGGAPATGGVSLSGLTFAVYNFISATGQAASGMGQIYTAASGDLQGGQQIQKAGDIASGPLTGVPTLIYTGNAASAQQVASYESALTAGAGLLDSKTSTQLLQGAVDFALSAIGLGGDAGCD